jgi:hypothetical protein
MIKIANKFWLSIIKHQSDKPSFILQCQSLLGTDVTTKQHNMSGKAASDGGLAPLAKCSYGQHNRQCGAAFFSDATTTQKTTITVVNVHPGPGSFLVNFAEPHCHRDKSRY